MSCKKLCFLGLFVTFLCADGKAQSVLPFYTEEDVVFKSDLVGKWDAGGATLEFRDAGNKAYGINIVGDNATVSHFRAHLIHIGRNYFVDVQVSGIKALDTGKVNKDAKLQIGLDGPNESFSLDKTDIILNRHHGLILIEFTKDRDEFRGHLWEDGWLPKMAKKKQLQCPYLTDEMGRVLLTGSSAQLRKFVEQLPLSAFGESARLARIKGEKK